MDRALAGAVPHLRDGAQGIVRRFPARSMFQKSRRGVHAALLVLLAMAFYGGFILAQWIRSGA